VKTGLYDYAVALNRRRFLKGATALGAMAALPAGFVPRAARAQDDLRAQILAIPGVGKGSPTDADWQKVGELCLAATKANVAEGEFAGVELTFMGLNNQNLHNFLFRGFLKPWEAYTGAKINWIDLAQADYNARLQQSIATGTVDFDVLEMGAPFEGDTAGKGLLDEMPDWVKAQIDMDDLRRLSEGAGRHLGRQDLSHIDRRRLPHLRLPQGLFRRGRHRRRRGAEDLAEINAISNILLGKKDPLTGLPAFGYLDPLKGWGGFGFYFLEDRATRLCQASLTTRPGCSTRTR
jgi:multiple sugar transport system substrate-binding protein